jgi:hypothetical protein
MMTTTTRPAAPEGRGANKPWQRKSMTMRMMIMACTLVGLNFLAAWLNIDEYRRRLLGQTTSGEWTTARTTSAVPVPVANVSTMMVVPMEVEKAEEDEAVNSVHNDIVVDDDDDSSACNNIILVADDASSTTMMMMIHDVTLEWRTHDVRRNNMWLGLIKNNNNCSDDYDDRGRNGSSGDPFSSTSAVTTTTAKKKKRPKPQPQKPPPPAMLLLTNYGWNQRNQTAALQLYRGVRSKELIEGVIHHPWFYPNSTEDWIETIYRHHYHHHYHQNATTASAVAKNVTHNNDTTTATTADVDYEDRTRYYVFLDYETCFERNYPVYGSNLERNADTGYNRTDNLVGMTTAAATNNPLLSLPAFSLAAVRQRYQRTIHQKLRQRQEKAATESHQHHPGASPPPPPQVTLISFHCGGNGLNTTRFSSGNDDVYAVISGRFDQLRPNVDLGLVPPALHQKVLTVPQQHNAKPHQPNVSSSWWCDESQRPYFILFSGNFRADTRQQLRRLHNGRDIYMDTAPPTNEPSMGAALLKSIFALTPRGDNLFSYRFTEVLSTGAIPVVHADDWMLPFDAPLVDWHAIVVRIPENRVNETVDILRAIPPARRCEMRRRGFAFWQTYMKDGDAVIRGIVDTLEGRRQQRRAGQLLAPATKKRQAPAKRRSETKPPVAPVKKRQAPVKRRAETTSPVAPAKKRQAPVKRRSETSPPVTPAKKRQAPARRQSETSPRVIPAKKRQAPAKQRLETTPPAVAAG